MKCCKPRDKYEVFLACIEGTALFEVLNFSSDFLFSESINAYKSGTHYSMELI